MFQVFVFVFCFFSRQTGFFTHCTLVRIMGGSKSYLCLLLSKSQKREHIQCGGPFKAVPQTTTTTKKKRVVTTVAKGCERVRKKQKATEMKEQRRKKGQLIIINVFIFFVQRACEFALCSPCCCMYIYFLSLFFFLSFTFCCCCCGCCCPGRKLTNIKTRNWIPNAKHDCRFLPLPLCHCHTLCTESVEVYAACRKIPKNCLINTFENTWQILFNECKESLNSAEYHLVLLSLLHSLNCSSFRHCRRRVFYYIL